MGCIEDVEFSADFIQPMRNENGEVEEPQGIFGAIYHVNNFANGVDMVANNMQCGLVAVQDGVNGKLD